ncbi:UNVERIFIED_CONTAM: hypothetical protein K2H54_053726 [Gekko kuhli]
MKEGQSRAHLIAQELVSSEKVYVEMLQQLHMPFPKELLEEIPTHHPLLEEEFPTLRQAMPEEDRPCPGFCLSFPCADLSGPILVSALAVKAALFLGLLQC